MNIKYDHKYLEYNENSSNIDHDTNDRLLKKTHVDKTNNKDFMWLRAFDKAISALIKAKQVLPLVNDESKRLLHSLIKDILSSIPSLSQFKSNDDYRLLTSYLLPSDTDYSQLFNQTLKNPTSLDLLWELALDQTFLTDDIEDTSQL